MVFDLDSAVRAKMFGHTSQRSGAWHKGISAPNHILLYGIGGEMRIEMEGTTYVAEEGDTLLIPLGTFYRPLEGGPCAYYFFHFHAEALPDGTQLPKQALLAPHTDLVDGNAYTCLSTYPTAVRLPTLLRNAPVATRGLFERAAKLRPGKRFSDQLTLDHLLRELLLLLSENDHPLPPRLAEITDYIEQNYEKDLSLSALAEHFALSPSYIARLFQQQLGKKPSAYVNEVRISAAGTLLSETDLSITEIAEKTGFSDVYYFSKVFKRTTGLSPSHIRSKKKESAIL